MTALAEAALAYARDGIDVFPLLPSTKMPAIPKAHGGSGFHDATTEIDQISQWWRINPNANIGVRPPAGVVVLDVDPRHDGDTELARLTKYRGELPPTWTAHTGSGGFHFWYRIGDTTDLRGQLCTGVDLKAHDTGYLVAPPSIHPNGRTYEWMTPPDGWPAEAPTWLRLAVRRPKVHYPTVSSMPTVAGGTGKYSHQCLVSRVAKAPEGRRNTVLYGACRDALRQGDLDAIERALIDAARACGLDENEITATMDSARRKGCI